MQTKDDKKQNDDIAELGNVDKIREILFGSKSREFKDKFDKLETYLISVHEEMRKKIEQNQNDFNARMDSEFETISKKIKNVTTQQQNEFSDLRDSSLKQEKRLQNAIDMAQEELNDKNEQLQKQQIQNNNAIRSQMDELKDELIKTLHDKISQLSGDKLSRHDAAEIMMEAAMAMKGQRVEEQLSISQTDPE